MSFGDPSRRADGRHGEPSATPPRKTYTLSVRGCARILGDRTWVMGVLNVTPDSFWSGSRRETVGAAVEQAERMFEDGADIVDVGGESTRPGAGARIEAAAERDRVVPVIAELRRRRRGLISIDTSRASVAAAALDAGADIVNDISGLRFDPEMASLIARRRCPVVLMHSRGSFDTMHSDPDYGDATAEVVGELAESVAAAERAGIAREAIVVDPGLGFAKAAPHTLTVLARLSALAALDLPLLVGPSRKSFIGHVLDVPVEERLMGTAAAVAAAVLAGAHVVRVHDVEPMCQIVAVCDALLAARAAA